MGSITLDIAVLAVNFAAAARALRIVLKALPVLAPSRRARRRLVLTAALLVLYMVGFAIAVLGANYVDRLTWSKVLIFAGPLAFLYVWPSLAELGVDLATQLAEANREAEERLESARCTVQALTDHVDRVA